MANSPALLGIDPADAPDLAELLRWWRKHRSETGEAEPRRLHGFIAHIGRADSAIAAGGTGTVSIWISPAWQDDSADTGRDIPNAAAFQAINEAQWVLVWNVNSKWHVTPLEC